MISDRYIDDIINDGQKVDDKKSGDLDKIAETLALKIDNKIDAALKKFEEKFSQPTPKDPEPTPKDPKPTPKDPEPTPNN